MRHLKMVLYFFLLLFVLESCDSSNVVEDDDTKKEEDNAGGQKQLSKISFIEFEGSTVYGHQNTIVLDVSNGATKFTIDHYDNSKIYTIGLEGEFLNESYTLNILSDVFHDSISTDTVHSTLTLDTTNVNLKSDYYTITLYEDSEPIEITSVYKYDHTKPLRLLDTSGSDFYTTIQFETDDWQPKDTLTTANFRMRPTPKLTNTAGKLYIYDQNLNVQDSLQSNGANGSNRNGITTWYSLKFSGSGLTTSNGSYIARFERRSENIVSPFRKITILKGENE